MHTLMEDIVARAVADGDIAAAYERCEPDKLGEFLHTLVEYAGANMCVAAAEFALEHDALDLPALMCALAHNGASVADLREFLVPFVHYACAAHVRDGGAPPITLGGILPIECINTVRKTCREQHTSLYKFMTGFRFTTEYTGSDRYLHMVN